MVLAIPSMLSIIGLMMIWVFVYAGIGTQVFPYVKYGRSLNKDANFETFPNSFLVLFQCLTVRLCGCAPRASVLTPSLLTLCLLAYMSFVFHSRSCRRSPTQSCSSSDDCSQ